MNLSVRLQCICDLIENCNLIADIGTDHAYIPIELIKSKKVKAAIATDIVEGPLNVALENVRLEGLQDQIEVFQSDGLVRYREKVPLIDYFIIAGMGGNTIVEILSGYPDIVPREGTKSNETSVKAKFILQPMTNKYELRRWLIQNGFEILLEKVAIEGSKYYNILVVHFKGVSNNASDQMPDFELYFGVNPQRDSSYNAYLAFEYHKHKAILEKIRASASKNTEKFEFIEKLVQELRSEISG